jgi:hypothetical protein
MTEQPSDARPETSACRERGAATSLLEESGDSARDEAAVEAASASSKMGRPPPQTEFSQLSYDLVSAAARQAAFFFQARPPAALGPCMTFWRISPGWAGGLCWQAVPTLGS